MMHSRSSFLLSALLVFFPLVSFAGTGILEVHSDPPGANVWIDDVPAGTTPFQDFEAPTGKHRVKAVLTPEYPPQIQEVVIDERTPQVILFKFIERSRGKFTGSEIISTASKYKGNATFASIPTGALVVINGEPLEKPTPIGYVDIEVGRYNVEFLLEGKSLRAEFDVIQGETVKLIADFGSGRVMNKWEEANPQQQADKQQADKQQADKQQADKQEAEKQEAEKQEADKQEADKQEADKQEAERQETEKQEAEKQEVDKQEADKQETEKQEAEKQEADKQEADKQEADKQEADKQEADKQKADKQKADKGEEARPEQQTAAGQEATQPPTGSAAAQPQPAEGIPPYGELEIMVKARREAVKARYSDFFDISFPKQLSDILSGPLFPGQSNPENSVRRDNFVFTHDMVANTRHFTAKLNFSSRNPERAKDSAKSGIVTVREGKYDLTITGRRLVENFYTVDKLLDATVREAIEIVRGNRLTVSIDSYIDADNKLRYEIKKTYVSLRK